MLRTVTTPALCLAAALAAVPGFAQEPKTGKEAQAQDAGGKKAVNAGEHVPQPVRDLTLKTATGESFSFSSWFKGKDAKDADAKKLHVLVFWSMECPYVKAWNPDLAQLYQEYSGKGVQFAAIDSNEGELRDAAKLTAAAKEQKIPFPVLLDEGNKLADWFGAQATPTVYLIDGKGRVVYTGAIDNDEQDKLSAEERKNYLKDALEAGLAGRDPATPSTKATGCSIKRAKTQS